MYKVFRIADPMTGVSWLQHSTWRIPVPVQHHNGKCFQVQQLILSLLKGSINGSNEGNGGQKMILLRTSRSADKLIQKCCCLNVSCGRHVGSWVGGGRGLVEDAFLTNANDIQHKVHEKNNVKCQSDWKNKLLQTSQMKCIVSQQTKCYHGNGNMPSRDFVCVDNDVSEVGADQIKTCSERKNNFKEITLTRIRLKRAFSFGGNGLLVGILVEMAVKT